MGARGGGAEGISTGAEGGAGIRVCRDVEKGASQMKQTHHPVLAFFPLLSNDSKIGFLLYPPQVLFHEVATPESKCLSLVVTDHLAVQCETINSVDPKLLYIPPPGSRAAAKLPGPISKEYLRRIVEIVDSDMTLAGPAQ